MASASPLAAAPPLGRSLTYGLFDRLGRAIVTGQFDATPFPVEMELVRQYGISLSVTREAVKMLTAKGLLSARPRQGTVVEPPGSWNLFDTDIQRWLLKRRFSPELLRHFTELRLAIEPEAASLAARAATPADIARIKAGLDRMAAAAQDVEEILDADIAFHTAILEAARNPFYAQFTHLVATALRVSIRAADQIDGFAASIANHAAVFDAIRGGAPDRARSSMRRLISDVPRIVAGAVARIPG
jgi:DNA-binding FadR family transcriptional regulator